MVVEKAAEKEAAEKVAAMVAAAMEVAKVVEAKGVVTSHSELARTGKLCRLIIVHCRGYQATNVTAATVILSGKGAIV